MTSRPDRNEVTQAQEPVSTASPRVWIDREGIVWVDYGFHAVLTEALVREAYRQGRILTGRRRAAVLIKGHNILEVEWEAYRFARCPEVSEATSAMALLVTTPLERYLAKIFLLYHRPAHPVRVFSNQEAAIAWLRPYIERPAASPWTLRRPA